MAVHSAPAAASAELLSELELRELPDLAGLKRQFKRLIKLYHPDANPGRVEWATQKSRRVIRAARNLEALLQQTAAPSAPPEASESPRPARSVSFQTIQDGVHGLAIPVSAIVRVHSRLEAGLRLAPPLPCASLQGEIYPLSSLMGELPASEIGFVLFARAQRGKLAIPLHRRVRFESILQMDEASLRRNNPAPWREGLWLRRGDEWRLCPAEFTSAVVAEFSA
ncbi:MAG: J domain-containing protein [Leptospirales bacterium]|nr:J domain-containing protein [Leptospirales bacterium]